MTEQNLKLIPFFTHSPWNEFSLSTSCHISDEQLELNYCLDGPIHQLSLPRPAVNGRGEFLENLWQNTCFELFVVENSQQKRAYWEFNFSPSGHFWYMRFTDYRLRDLDLEEALPHPAAPSPLIRIVQQNQQKLEIVVKLPYTAITKDNFKDEKWCNLSAVTLSRDMNYNYWAFNHDFEKKADFHDITHFKKF